MANDHFKNFGTKVISIEVGEDSAREIFTVHENLIRKSSQFFETTLGGNDSEAQDRIVKLPKKDPSTFKLYLNWLYTTHCSSFNMPEAESEGLQSQWCSLLEAYLLGDYLKDTNFKDTTMDAMLQWGKTMNAGQIVKTPALFWGKVYEATDPGSPLRLFLVNHCAWAFSKGFIKSLEEIETQADFPLAFTRHVIDRMADVADAYNRRGPPYPAKDHCNDGSCAYHCHGQEPCYKTKSKK